MNDSIERICMNCNNFLPDTFKEASEHGICLDDEVFEPYLDELFEGNHDVCRDLIEEKKLLAERECCDRYEEAEFVEVPAMNVDEFFDLAVTKRKEEPLAPEYSFKDHSFSQLMEISEQLKKLRVDFASRPAEERRMAADYEYHASSADQLFYDSIGQPKKPARIPGEVVALAIDPEYAPAILTVGTHEYIHGRVDEAMELLLSFVELPEDTEDLFVIIDKAGAFLIDREEYDFALALYTAAAEKFPGEELFKSGVKNCNRELG